MNFNFKRSQAGKTNKKNSFLPLLLPFVTCEWVKKLKANDAIHDPIYEN
jgi:hypothetical protein